MFKCAMLAFVITSGIIFAQSFSKTSANINVKLLNATAMSIEQDKQNSQKFLKTVHSEFNNSDTSNLLLHLSGDNVSNLIININYTEHLEPNMNDNNSFIYQISESFTIEDTGDKSIYLPIDIPYKISLSDSDNNLFRICFISLVHN